MVRMSKKNSTFAENFEFDMRKISIILFCCLATLVCHAQFAPGASRPVVSADSTVAQRTWFDPTRAPEKEKEVYQFGVDYRIEVGYAQNQQRSLTGNMMNPFLHGVRVAGLVDFKLPLHFYIQTGLGYTLGYGRIDQHWSSIDLSTQQVEYVRHNITEHLINIPVRAYYVQPLWKELRLLFFAGPELEIGLAQTDRLKNHLSGDAAAWLTEQGVLLTNHDRYQTGELSRANIQMGVGGGLEWNRYRVVAGYDFGLNNLVRTPLVSKQHVWEWGWQVSFSYRF